MRSPPTLRQRIALAALATLILSWLGIWGETLLNNARLIEHFDGARLTAPVDFSAIWAAARLAVEGAGVAAFDHAALTAVQGPDAQNARLRLDWLYPPNTLLILAPLGALPFLAAWMVFIACSMAVLGLALFRAFPGRHALAIVLLLSPATLVAANEGQLTMLVAGAMLLGLIAMQRDARWSAAAWLALAAIKPQNCAALMVVLVAGRAGGTGLRMMLLLGALLGVSVLVFGTDYPGTWIAALEAHRVRMVETTTAFGSFMSVYSGARELGVDPEAAMWLHLAVAGGAMTVVATAWAGRGPIDARKAGLLLVATPLIHPWAWYYTSLFALLGIALLQNAEERGTWRRHVLAALCAVIWLAPLLHRVPFGTPPHAFIMIPAALAALVIGWRAGMAAARRA